MSNSEKIFHTFTGNTSFAWEDGRASNITLEWSSGTGTITHTMTETGVTVRTPATADEGYNNLTRDNTWTASGTASTPVIILTIEPIGPKDTTA